MSDQRSDEVLRALSPGLRIDTLWPPADRDRAQTLLLTATQPDSTASPSNTRASEADTASSWTVVAGQPVAERARPRRRYAAIALLAACVLAVTALGWTLTTNSRLQGGEAPAGRGATLPATPTPASAYPAVPASPNQGTSAFEKSVFADGVITYDEFIAAAHLYADCMSAHGIAMSVDTTSIPGGVQYTVTGSITNEPAAADLCAPGTNGLIEPLYGAGTAK